MQISELMTRNPITVTPNQTIGEAAAIMEKSDLGFLPVGEDDRMVGMITDRDIALRGAGLGKTPNTLVRDAMTEDVRYCFDDEEAEAVVQNLGSQQIRRIPVVSRSEKRLVGIVSLGDIAERASGGDAGAALERIAQPGGAHT